MVFGCAQVSLYFRLPYRFGCWNFQGTSQPSRMMFRTCFAVVAGTFSKQVFAMHRCSSCARTEFDDLFQMCCRRMHPTLRFRRHPLFKSSLGGACPTAPASVVLRAPWLFDLGCVGMASANHNIRLRRSAVVLLEEPFWRTPEESLTAWFVRIELPEEFHAGIDHNVEIVYFACNRQRIE